MPESTWPIGANALTILPAVIGTAIAICWFVPAGIVYCALVLSGRISDAEDDVLAQEILKKAARDKDRTPDYANQGGGKGHVPGHRTLEIDLEHMTPEEIAEALSRG